MRAPLFPIPVTGARVVRRVRAPFHVALVVTVLGGIGVDLTTRDAGGVPGSASVVADSLGSSATAGGAISGGATTSPPAWSSCRPVRVVVDVTDAPADFVERVRAETAALSAVTGLAIVHEGLTSEAASMHRRPYQPGRYGDRWAPVLVRFADPEVAPELVSPSGLSGAWFSTDATTGTRFVVSGAIYLSTSLLRTSAFDADTPAYVPVLRHELGHLLGLEHVDDPTQLMHPVIGNVLTFQEGDLARLAAAGHGPCSDGR